MTKILTHEEAADQLEIVALGAAPPDIKAAVVAHLEECDRCRRMRWELAQWVADLSELIPETPLSRGRSAGIRSRLLARAESDVQGEARRRVAAARENHRLQERVSSTPIEGRRTSIAASDEVRAESQSQDGGGREARLWPFAVVLAVIAVAAAGGALAGRAWSPEREPVNEALGREVEMADQIDSLELLLRAREQALGSLTGATVRIANLTNRGSQGRPLARMFWDPAGGRWSLFVYELREPRAGRTYQAWIGAGDRRTSLGTFTPEANGTAFLEGRLGASAADFRLVTISEESAGGVSRPTGTVVLAGVF